MINNAINTITSSPQMLLDSATTFLPQNAYNAANNVVGVPASAYNYVNGIVGWDIGTTALGAGLMAVSYTHLRAHET